MKEFKNEKLNISFTLPEKITVRQQLNYFSEVAFAFGKERFEMFWLGAIAILQDWKCDLIPSIGDFNLDEATDPKVTEVVMWTGWEVKKFIDSLDSVPKN